MEEIMYIVIWTFPKASNPKWRASAVYSSRRLAENYIECEKERGETCTYAIVEGPITDPAQEAAIEQTLGTF